MSEFVDSAEELQGITPAVSIFGSARTRATIPIISSPRKWPGFFLIPVFR
jgi:hypothetical protein